MIYLDNAATTLYKPRAVEQAVRRAMYGAAGYARGGYAAASRAGELVYACREQAAALFGVGEPERVIFTLNATHALNIAINALVKPDSRVIVSGYEHNAVMRPLTARNIEPTVLDTPLWDGAAMVSALKQALEHGADLMILSHVSNVFGSIAPLDEIAELLTAAGVPLILDASQSAGVAEIDVKRYPCLAAVCMPGHKALYGPEERAVCPRRCASRIFCRMRSRAARRTCPASRVSRRASPLSGRSRRRTLPGRRDGWCMSLPVRSPAKAKSSVLPERSRPACCPSAFPARRVRCSRICSRTRACAPGRGCTVRRSRTGRRARRTPEPCGCPCRSTRRRGSWSRPQTKFADW